MNGAAYRFDRFLLLADDRQLIRDREVVEVSGRYFDALTLLVREPGRLVTKERFMDEVWRGVPVTDEALTQCIRTLRRLLGDEAGRPRFIETVPKHGYRFIAPVEEGSENLPPTMQEREGAAWQTNLVRAGVAGTGGGVAAGLVGGLAIGFVAAGEGPTGAASALLVLLCVTVLVGLLGGAGVAFGIAGALSWRGRFDGWSVAGGAAGGLLVGAVVKLLGSDAFMLLVGRSPGDITGAGEGAMLGGALGLACWIGDRLPLRRAMAVAAGLGGVAGVLVTLLGGRLLIGSLDRLAGNFPESRLQVDKLGALLGEEGLGSVSLALTAGLEGALFGAFLVGALLTVERRARP